MTDDGSAGGEATSTQGFWEANYRSLLQTEWAITEFADMIAPLCEGRSVLELGCGAGQLSVLLARTARHVTAVDFSPAALTVARERGRGLAVEFRQADIVGIDFGRRFDVICGSAVLHEVPRERFDALLDGIQRHLAPGGTCAFLENSGFNPFYRAIRRYLVGRLGLRKVGSDQETPMDRDRWERITRRFSHAERRGEVFVLFDRAWYQFGNPVLAKRLPVLANRLGRRCTALDQYLGRRCGNSGFARYWSFLQTLRFSDNLP